jgi:hypothetical protein
MYIYIASTLSPKRLLDMADSVGAKNFLFTFAHDGARKCAIYFAAQQRPDLRLLIDSGAFSAWKGKCGPIVLRNYIDFAKQLSATARCLVEFIALDVIAGSFVEREAGKLPTKQQTDEACRQGFENYLEMERAGVPCLPTFHRDDEMYWLDRITKRAERFCLAPRADHSTKSVKMRWLNECFRHMGPAAWEKYRIHCLGISSEEILETYPFYSVDSTEVQVGQRGCPYLYFDGYRTRVVLKSEWGDRVWESQLAMDSMGDPSAMEAIRHYEKQGQGSKDGEFGTYWFMKQAMRTEVQSEQYITEHWKNRGVTGDAVQDGEDYQPRSSTVATNE